MRLLIMSIRPLNPAIFKYVSWLTFIVLLIGMTSAQTHLKSDPQVYLLGFTFLTLLSYLFFKETATILFAVLFGVILYTNFFTAFAFLSRDHLGITSMVYASLLTMITLFLYFKYYPRQQFSEKLFTIAFMVISVIVFVIYEI